MDYILALDAGTTSIKAVLFDTNGRPAAVAAREYELSKPAPDLVELAPEIYWEAATAVIREVLARSGVPMDRIRALGICSQGETLIVLDETGRPLRPAIVWLDNRSGRQAAQIAAAFKIDDVYRLTGQPEIIPTWTATKILWIREHEPEVFRKARKYLLVEDYLLYRLTGRHATDRALLPSTLYFDIISGEWWPEMLRFLDIRADQLPELRYSGQVAGNVTREAARDTGLSTNTVVTVGPLDQVAGAVGAGNIAPGIITETTGAAMAICATVDAPTYDAYKRFPCHTHALPGKYILLSWVPTAGMAFRWFRDEFGQPEIQQAAASGTDAYALLCEQAAAVAPGADGLILLPHLSGAACPEFNPKARGVFYGFTLGHTKAHFVRALLESIAFLLRNNLTVLEEHGVDIAEVRSLGGAARSDLWLQVKADVIGRPIVRLAAEEAAALGTAILAGVGTRLFTSVADACRRMVAVEHRFQPNPANRALYDRQFDRYRRLYDSLVGLFSD